MNGGDNKSWIKMQLLLESSGSQGSNNDRQQHVENPESGQYNRPMVMLTYK